VVIGLRIVSDWVMPDSTGLELASAPQTLAGAFQPARAASIFFIFGGVRERHEQISLF
jgi:hypothetical protein